MTQQQNPDVEIYFPKIFWLYLRCWLWGTAHAGLFFMADWVLKNSFAGEEPFSGRETFSKPHLERDLST